MTSYASPNFKLRFCCRHGNTVVLSMQFPNDCWMTDCLPKTFSFLQKHQPSVLNCWCENDNDCSFAEEVKHTELAHLFEHLVIDHMCQRKSKSVDAEFVGETEWDWHKHPIGSFKISLQVKDADEKYLQPALIDSVYQLESLFNFHKH